MTPDERRAAVTEILTVIGKPMTVKEIIDIVDDSFFKENSTFDAKQTMVNDTLFTLRTRGKVVRSKLTNSKAFYYLLASTQLVSDEPVQVATPSKLPDSLSIDGITYFAESLVTKMVQEKKVDKGHVAKLRRIGSTRTMSGEFSALEFDTFDNDLRPGQMLRIIVEN